MPSIFPPTQWGMVVQSAANTSPATDMALAELCQQYWPAVYGFIRGRGYGVEDAEDLTQDFFAYILTREWLGRADPNRGKFRAFLLTSVTNFVNDARDRARSDKRGGKHAFISLDSASAEASYTAFGATGFTPDKTFDAQWATTLVAAAMKRLRDQYVSEDKGETFDRLHDFLTLDPAKSYEEAAQALDTSAGTIKNYIHRLRQRYGELLREEISRTLAEPGEVESELRYLCTVL